jgi:hypothetical protein
MFERDFSSLLLFCARGENPVAIRGPVISYEFAWVWTWIVGCKGMLRRRKTP